MNLLPQQRFANSQPMPTTSHTPPSNQKPMRKITTKSIPVASPTAQPSSKRSPQMKMRSIFLAITAVAILILIPTQKHTLFIARKRKERLFADSSSQEYGHQLDLLEIARSTNLQIPRRCSLAHRYLVLVPLLHKAAGVLASSSHRHLLTCDQLLTEIQRIATSLWRTTSSSLRQSQSQNLLSLKNPKRSLPSPHRKLFKSPTKKMLSVAKHVRQSSKRKLTCRMFSIRFSKHLLPCKLVSFSEYRKKLLITSQSYSVHAPSLAFLASPSKAPRVLPLSSQQL